MINNQHLHQSLHNMLENIKVEESEISREHPHYKMSFEQRLEGGEGGSHGYPGHSVSGRGKNRRMGCAVGECLVFVD